MRLQQIRREIQELQKAVISNKPNEKVLPTPEFLRCSKELEMAQARARQRLIDNGISESELLERERRGLICDAEVMNVRHNLLRAAWNAKNQDERIKINYLFDCPVEVENYKRAFDKMNALLNKDRTPEVIDTEKELFQIMQDAGR